MCSSTGFDVALTAGVQEYCGIFVTTNMVKALKFTAGILVSNSLVVSIASGLTIQSSIQYHDNPEEANGDSTDTEPLINSHEGVTQTKTKKNVGFLLLVVSLVSILALPYLLMVTTFNTCPVLNSLQHGNISCSSSSPTVGSECSIVCSPHYLSSSSPHSSCTWRGVWSVHLECRRQVAAVIGPGAKHEEQGWYPAAEVYPATNSTSLPPLPEDLWCCWLYQRVPSLLRWNTL